MALPPFRGERACQEGIVDFYFDIQVHVEQPGLLSRGALWIGLWFIHRRGAATSSACRGLSERARRSVEQSIPDYIVQV